MPGQGKGKGKGKGEGKGKFGGVFTRKYKGNTKKTSGIRRAKRAGEILGVLLKIKGQCKGKQRHTAREARRENFGVRLLKI